jgi:hypothetical protein
MCENGKPRNLRILLIDDEIRTFLSTYSFLEPVRVATYGSAAEQEYQTQISTWAQLLHVISMRHVLQFDLLLIDVRFHTDTTDPLYFNEDAGGAPDETRPNPIGLLLGAVVASNRAERDRPFAFSIFSGDAMSVSEDPVAINSYGFLMAIDGHPFCSHLKSSDVSAHVSQCIKKIGVVPEDVLIRDLLDKYRERLCEFVRVSGSIDIEALEVIVGRSGQQRRVSDSDSLVFVNREGLDRVRIASVCGDWLDMGRESEHERVFKYLERLRDEFYASQVDLYQHVVEVMSQVDEMRRADGNVSQFTGVLRAAIQSVTGRHPPEEVVALASVLCTCLELIKECAFIGARRRENVMEFLCVGPNSQPTIDRQLQRCEELHPGMPTSLGKLLGHLDAAGWLPPRVKECCRRYAREIVRLETLPKWLE